MTVLIIGVVFWSGVHLFPAIMPGTRQRLMKKLGAGPYRGLFALDIVIALVLIVVGWRTATIQSVYVPPLYGSPIVTMMMLLSFYLFAAANAPGNIKRFLRHPMLIGMMLWAGAHLLSNGDNRSIILFGGLGAWALLEIIAIGLRDGAWEKPEPVPVSRDLITIVASGVIFIVVIYVHEAVIGVSPLPAM